MELLKQTDKKWAKEIIGKSGYSIGGSGCVLASLCNCANLHGLDWTPDDLNRALYNKGGLTDTGLVVWDSVAKTFGCRINPFYFMRDDKGKVTAGGQLDFNNNNCYYIGRYINKGIGHFSNILGKSGSYYIVYDVYSGSVVVKNATDINRIVKMWW